MGSAFVRRLLTACLLLGSGCAAVCHAQSAAPAPAVRLDRSTGHLLVHDQPFVALAGELGNSSAGTPEQADSILPRLARMHLNTVLVPVCWDQIEPTEGHFDFALLDHWIATARAQNLHLVLLWFGSWKNATSGYAPAWVKRDPRRFPRVMTAAGEVTDTLTPLGAETLRADSHAFAELLARLAQTDNTQATVLMVQVENEIGVLGQARDRSPEANRLFAGAVPHELLASLAEHRYELSPELAAAFQPGGHTWGEAFGDRADEVFMAWQYGRFVQSVAAAGKARYALPLYTNAQLPAERERAGEYPSGGPHPYFLDVYRAAAPAIDVFSPDIYWPEFEHWVSRYMTRGNPAFIPEARLDTGPYNALYAFGQARAIGFSPFAVDSLPEPTGSSTPLLAEVYATLESLEDLLPAAQSNHRSAGLVLHANSARPSQTVALGGYLFHATLARTWPANTLAEDHGAMLVLQTAPDEFLIAGVGLTVTFTSDPDAQNAGRTAGLLSVEEVKRNRASNTAEMQILRRLNGDQTNQNRALMTDANRVALYRVRLYTISNSSSVPNNP